MNTPATMLKGKLLKGKWEVLDFVEKPKSGTGGNFSVAYTAINKINNKEVFLKALDFSRAMIAKDRLKAHKQLVDEYYFERNILLKCRSNKLSKISVPIDHGSLDIHGFGEFSVVYYLIFELAKGDIRKHLDLSDKFDLCWNLKILHHVAIGIKQLHWCGITHQDIKPSNILVMKENSAKISDLGRASDKESRFIFDDIPFAGDPSYAPIDSLYSNDMEVFEYKFMCDLYLLGNLIFFLFAKININQAIRANLNSDQLSLIGNTGFNEILPYLQEAFSKVLSNFKEDIKNFCSEKIADEIVLLAKQLCEPNPKKRGDIKWQTTVVPNHDLQRVISKLDNLVERARFYR